VVDADSRNCNFWPPCHLVFPDREALKPLAEPPMSVGIQGHHRREADRASEQGGWRRRYWWGNRWQRRRYRGSNAAIRTRLVLP